MLAQDDINYQNLLNLIRQRQGFEAKHPVKPYVSAKTDLDFRDLQGNALINYAIACDDLAAVQSLVSQGASIVAEYITQALNQDRIPIAEWLYNHTDTCYDLKLSELISDTGRQWLRNKIVLDIKENIDEQNNYTISPHAKLVKMAPNERALPRDYLTISQELVLTRYTEANNWSYFDLLSRKKHFSLNPMVHAHLLQNAIAFGNKNKIDDLLKLCEKLPSHQAEFVKAFGLRYALLGCYNYTLADYLQSKGADINRTTETYAGNTILGEAIALNQQPLETIKYLIAKGADVCKLNCHGQNMLHLAIQRGDEEIIAYIQSLLPEDYSERKDIFSKKAADYYQTQEKISLSQTTLFNHLDYFLRLDYCPNNKELAELRKGVCNGLSRLFQLYTFDYFFQTIRMINAWDGSEAALLKPFADYLPQKKYYKNLKELMQTWASQIVLSQASSLPESFHLNQDDRIQQHHMMTDKQAQLPVYLYKLIFEDSNLQKIEEILYYFYKLPGKARLEFCDDHSTSAYRVYQDHILYYDCNFPLNTYALNTFADVKNIILNSKLKLYNTYMDLITSKQELLLYIHQEDIAKLEGYFYELLKPSELPRNKREAIDFQKRSPNKFTPLHIAILGRDTFMLSKLLNDDFCNVNAVDANGLSALYLAVQSNFSAGVKLLLAHKSIDLSIINENDTLAKMFPYLNPDILKDIVNHKNSSPLPNLSRYAIFYRDQSLLKDLVRQHKFLASDEDLSMAMLLALQKSPPDKEMIDFLLRNGAKITQEPFMFDCEPFNFEKISPYDFVKKNGGASFNALVEAVSVLPFDENHPPPKGTVLLLRETNAQCISDQWLMNYLCKHAGSFRSDQLSRMIASIKKDSSSTYQTFALKILAFAVSVNNAEIFDQLFYESNFFFRAKADIFKMIVDNRGHTDGNYLNKLIAKGFDVNQPIGTYQHHLFGMPDVTVTPLSYAIQKCADNSVIDALINAGADLDRTDDYYQCTGQELLSQLRN